MGMFDGYGWRTWDFVNDIDGYIDTIPPPGSIPGYAGGHFGGEGRAAIERWDPPFNYDVQGMVDSPNSEPAPKKGGFFKSKPDRFDFWDLLGAFGDAFGDGPPLYVQSLMRQRQARDEEEQYQRRRQDARGDWALRREPELQRFGPQQWQALGDEDSAGLPHSSPAHGHPTYDSRGLFGIRHLKRPVP